MAYTNRVHSPQPETCPAPTAPTDAVAQTEAALRAVADALAATSAATSCAAPATSAAGNGGSSSDASKPVGGAVATAEQTRAGAARGNSPRSGTICR